MTVVLSAVDVNILRPFIHEKIVWWYKLLRWKSAVVILQNLCWLTEHKNRKLKWTNRPKNNNEKHAHDVRSANTIYEEHRIAKKITKTKFHKQMLDFTSNAANLRSDACMLSYTCHFLLRFEYHAYHP